MNETIEKILANILTIKGETSLSESFFETVLNRLVSFGYKPKEDDAWVLCFTTQKVENHIKNSCNITSIPDGLFHIAVDMVCGEFLFNKKQIGQLEIDDLDLTGAITSISEGDTTIQFASGATDEDKLNRLIQHLMTKGEGDFVCYRRLRW